MTRTLTATISAAITDTKTKPIHLIHMGWDAASPTPTYLRAATYDSNITWGGHTWIASGLNVTNLDANGGNLEMPMGDSDPWLALVLGQLPRNRTIDIYERQTNFAVSPHASDAVLIFSGYMDEAQIGNTIRVNLIESATRKGFPPGRIDRPTYTHLLKPGTRIQWGLDTVMVNG